jgi:iron complex outermembrane receptor protein
MSAVRRINTLTENTTHPTDFCNHSRASLINQGTSCARPYTLSVLAASLITALVSPVHAAEMERISVTGSHIQRADLETASPVTLITHEQIVQSGHVNLENLLQEISASAGPAGNATNAYWTSNGYGTAQINLRGLGINRTLVLLNGKRVVNGGTGANASVDLNMIPVGMIERIDVLKDGASAIYGADAIAGVINIITKRSQKGVKVSGKYGQTSKGDGKEKQINVSTGINQDKLTGVINLSYIETGAIVQSSRSPCPLKETATGLNCIGNSSTIGGRAHLNDGTELQFNQEKGGNGDFFEAYDNDKHGLNWFNYLNAQSPMERLNVSASFEYEINSSLSLYTDLLHSQRKSNQIITPRSLKAIPVSKDFIYNPTGQDLTLKKRRLIEVDTPHFFQDVDITQGLVGLKGQLPDNWQWDLSYSFGRNTAKDGWSSDIDHEKVAQTLDMSQCSTTPAAAIPCGDFFGAYELSPQVIDYVTYSRLGTGGNQLSSANFSLSGDIIDLPAGSLSSAFGIEHRNEQGWRNPDPVVLQSGAEDAIDGDVDVSEAFAEFNIPLLADMAYLKKLDLSLAGRYSDYSTFGGQSTYKLGLVWQVNDELMLRSVKSTAFRAPSVPELFGGTNQENLPTNDPCDGATGVMASNCLADNVPVGFSQDGTTVLTGVGGNINVQPEKADTLTLGLVYEPSFIDGLSMTVDYFDIEVENAIAAVDGSNQLRLCYTDPLLYKDFCQGFSRNPITHQIVSLSKQPLNAALEQVAGIDSNISYNTELAGIAFGINLDATRLLTHENQAFPDAEPEVLLGKITADRGSFAKWKANLGLVLVKDDWQGSWDMRYLGKADDQQGGLPIGRAVPSIIYHDARVKWSPMDRFSTSIGIDNLFDTKAPYLTSWNDANTDVFTYDLAGRRFYLQFELQI